MAREIPSLFLTSITRTRGRNSWGSSRVAAMVGENVILVVQRYNEEKLQMFGKILSKW